MNSGCKVHVGDTPAFTQTDEKIGRKKVTFKTASKPAGLPQTLRLASEKHLP